MREEHYIQPTEADAELLSAYVEADRVAKEATARSDALKAQLKTRLADSPEALLGDAPNVALQVGAVRASLRYQESWRLDSARLKREQPVTYAAYAKQTGSLVLRLGIN